MFRGVTNCVRGGWGGVNTLLAERGQLMKNICIAANKKYVKVNVKKAKSALTSCIKTFIKGNQNIKQTCVAGGTAASQRPTNNNTG